MIPTVDYIRILPELVLSLFGIIVMMADPLLPEQGSKKSLGNISLIGVLAALAATVYQTGYYGSAFYHTIRIDTFSVFFHFVVLLIALVVILTSYEYLDVQRIRSGEYYALILFGTVGMMLMSAAVELVLIFIALEISSISTYILAGMRRRAAESAEASLEIFPARFLRYRVFPLRRGHDLWRHRNHQRIRHSPATGDAAVHARLPRCGTHVCRFGIQGCRSALSCMDTRRL